ncbi:tyrosine-type recombinase/integrase [Pseudofulvibacter geojedonensis]|uniref:Tyrosine-type recombinase/integrase n=1 Tax=Pseudofulvibacter geojedonensis TaxID=1123758 RepID=A0ABW3I0I3_9FLAO
MISFSEYLYRKAYSDTTVKSYDGGANKFLLWCKQKRLDPCTMNYKQCLKYTDYLNNKKSKNGGKLSANSVGHQLGVVKVYFEYLVFTEQHSRNLLKGECIKDGKQEYEHVILTSTELEELYSCYEALDVKKPYCKHVAMRNKVLVGLAVYQGMDAGELVRIKVDDVNVHKGSVYVSGTRKRNRRTLKLDSSQIVFLMDYLRIDRPILQKRINCESEALFPSNTTRTSSLTSPVFRQLKKMNMKVTNLKQIRASVITKWIKEHNLLEAQRRAGHRFISSTEAYLKNDHTEMHEEIGLYHPIQ